MGLYLTDPRTEDVGAVAARRYWSVAIRGAVTRLREEKSGAFLGGFAPPPSRISVVASHSSGHSGGDESFGRPHESRFRQERSE